MKNIYVALIGLLISSLGFAQISVTSLPQTDTENFFTYVGDLATTPAGWSVSPNDYEGIGTGSGSAGGFYAYAPTAIPADKSFGVLRSGSSTFSFEVNFTNNSGSTITSLDIFFSYEQYRYANTSDLDIEGIGALSGNPIINVEDFDGVASGTNGTPSNARNVTLNLTGLSIANGATYGLRWTLTNDSGADNGLAVDNFSITADGGSGPSPGITLGTVSGNTTEAGGTATFTVVLDTQPATDVVLDITSVDTGEVSVLPTTLTFTNGNWDTTQLVTATGIDDGDLDGDVDVTVNVVVNDGSSDDDYDGLSESIIVTNEDDEVPPVPTTADAWINEIHYDNNGGDLNEGVEIVIADISSFPLNEWSVVLYNGNNDQSYDTIDYTTPDSQSTVNGFTIAWRVLPANGIQNGAPDGLALVHDDGSTETVIQFLSYEGTITAVNGPANGLTSEDIQVSESDATAIDESLQLSGIGTQYEDFSWETPATQTRGLINNNQSFFTLYTYAGGSWSPSDPSGASTSDEAIRIENGDATITATTDINTLTINPGAGLTINSGITLTASTTTLESTSTSFSSLIVEGTFVGNITYNRYTALASALSGGTNDLVAPPVSGDSFGAFATRNGSNLYEDSVDSNIKLFGPFDTGATTPAYLSYTVGVDDGEALIPGKGYRAGTTTGNNSLSFFGTPELGDVMGDVTVEILNGGATDFRSWNLVANPFSSYVDAFSVLDENSAILDDSFVAIYGYDADSGDGSIWTIWTIADIIANNIILNGSSTEALAPGQGFFVKGKNATADFTFNTAWRKTASEVASGDDFISGRAASPSVTIDKLQLELSKNNVAHHTKIYFTDAATRGLDPGYDAGGFGGNGGVLFSHLVEQNNGIAMAVQSLPYNDLMNVTIPLGVNANQGELITFSIFEHTLPVGTNVYLDDTGAGVSTNLTTNDYVLTTNSQINGTGRFFLRFENSALSVNEDNLNTLQLFTDARTRSIIVSGELFENTECHIIDMQGRLVKEVTLDRTIRTHAIRTSGLSSGVYIVKISNALQSKTAKIILN